MEKNTDARPMFVTLYEKDRYMASVWIPAENEGRFSFYTPMGEKLPVYVEAEGGKWYAVTEENGFFATYGQKESRMCLEGGAAVPVIVRNRNFFLYSETVCENDNAFLPYYIAPNVIPNNDIRIGRKDCDISYPLPFVSTPHARLKYTEGDWYILDDNSLNGVYVNGCGIHSHRLVPGDIINILGLCIIYGFGYILINNVNNRVRINSRNVRPVNGRCDLDYAPPMYIRQADPFFERSPRKKYLIPKKTIELEMPPQSLSANGIPFLLRMGNPILTGGRAIVTGNPFSALTSLMLPFLTQGLSEKDRKEYEKLRKEKYLEYLEAIRKEIIEEIQTERDLMQQSYPHIAGLLSFPEERTRLWERRKADDDFLSVRLGRGTLPMKGEVTYPKKRFEVEKDELVDKMYELAEEPKVISGAPIMVSLRNNTVTSVTGDRQSVLLMVRNIIAQLALTHSYDELKIVFLYNADERGTELLDFAAYLPHCWNNERSARLMASCTADAQQLSTYLGKIWEQALNPPDPTVRIPTPKDQPDYLVIAADKNIFDRIELMKKVVALEKGCGITVLTAFDAVPKECTALIRCSGQQTSIVDFTDPTGEELEFVADTLSDEQEKLLSDSMHQVMGTRLQMESAQFTLPKSISFLEMYGVGKVEYLHPFLRWKENNPIKSLAAPVGIGSDGKLFMLDLHEKYQGPHGLIAGGTGSGKSQFIITYILSMAVNYSPDEVAFVLIDYKGGGLTDAFVDDKNGKHLPHVVATITNLDGAAIQRSLLSIKSEVTRRQAVFKKAREATGEGTMEIYDYQRLFRAHRVSEPMPHLFIIADEFAELKKNEPEFMDELISIARIGRSLGVHLILATQKPSGVVNDQIVSNTKFRICLRVATKADSMEMLKRPDAAELKNVGRFYLQVGFNEFFALGQSGWCGADYFPSEVIEKKVDNSVQFIDNVGQVILEAKPKTGEERKSEGKQVDVIVNYLSDYFKRENIPVRKLWCDPLPGTIDLAGIPAADKGAAPAFPVTVGMVDDPEHQTQYPFVVDIGEFHHALVCGISGSGKSSFVKTLLHSLISAYSPEEVCYYLIDLSGGALSAYSKAPHCGAYLTENDSNGVARLFDFIKEMVQERKKLFAAAEVSNFEAYCRIAPLPAALVVIDNTGFLQSLPKGALIHSDLGNYMKECASYGIKFILTAGHLNEVHSKARQEVDYRIAFMGKDKFDYGDMLDRKCAITVPEMPGRGVAFIDDRTLEIQMASLFADYDEADRVRKIKEFAAQLWNTYAGSAPVKALPSSGADETYEDFMAGFGRGNIPLGYSLKNMKAVALPFRQFNCMSLYFGNPFGAGKVLSNLMSAAGYNGMEVIFVRRSSDSVMDSTDFRFRAAALNRGFTAVETTETGLAAVRDRVVEELAKRNLFRDRYCADHGIPSSNKKRTVRAGAYIREHTVPLLIVFESFGDVCRLEKTELMEDVAAGLGVCFQRLAGYNIYFAAGFYPEDADTVPGTPMMRAYNPEQFCMLFGGRYDKQCLVSSLPMDYRRINTVDNAYDKFIMLYQDNYYEMRMPCGELELRQREPDEEPIV